MTDETRKRALALYRGPFRYDVNGGGYIWDANAEMVADGAGYPDAATRVRGWGRIGYMPDAAALQDAAGELIAEALTEFWAKHGRP